MHILLIHQAFASINQPGGTRHYEIARNLAKAGHQVTIIASPISYLTGKSVEEDTTTEPGITVIRSYTYPSLHKSFFHRLISFFSFMISSFFNGLKVTDVDIVWGTSPPIFQGFTAWLIAKLKGIPFLFEVRDLWPEFAIAIGVLKNPLLISASRWLERFLYRNAKTVIVNSPGYTEYVSLRGAKDVKLIPNGVDPEMFIAPNHGIEFRRENDLKQCFVVLYAGAHGVSNDLGVVIKCAYLLREHQDIIFVLVGDGKDKPILIQNAQELGLKNLRFLPAVPKSHMAEVLAAADVCIAILKPLECYKTTYPNKVFDYMAAAKPIVLAIDGVIRQVVEQAQCGIIVPPGDERKMATAILWLKQNPKQAENMGKAGLDYVKKYFNRNELSAQMTDIILQLIHNK